jgi:hypothetical protein
LLRQKPLDSQALLALDNLNSLREVRGHFAQNDTPTCRAEARRYNAMKTDPPEGGLYKRESRATFL